MADFFLGIDVSKGYADFVLLNDRKQPLLDPFQLDDTFEGHNRLYEFLQAFVQRHPDAHIFAAAESSGAYENNWIAALRRFQAQLPLQVARLNPALVQRNAQAEGTRTTTDTTSARAIAVFLINYPQKVSYQQDDTLAPLRAHYTFLEHLTKERTALVSQIESVLYRAHPDLVRFFCNDRPKWLMTLLLQYPTAARLGRARARTLAKIPYLSLERARELIAAARQSVASASDPATEHLVAGQIRHLLYLDASIDKQKQFISAHMLLCSGRVG